MTTYQVIRFYADEIFSAETVRTGLTLAQAQAVCNDPETSSRTARGPAALAMTAERGEWFCGYRREETGLDDALPDEETES